MKKLMVLLATLVLAVTGLVSPAHALGVQDEVNSLPYAAYVAGPAVQAFELVTASRGWDADRIAQWEPFATAVMFRESKFCWDVRGGAKFKSPGLDCELKRQGRRGDSGFGQVIGIHYRPGRWLCAQEGLCSANQIVASPWNSMVAFVALLERNGSQPWCYTRRLRASYTCRLAP